MHAPNLACSLSRETIDPLVPTHGKAKGLRIDLGLEVIEAVRLPGERLTHEDIAAVCGCSDSAIREIELKALRKIRKEAKRRGLTLEDLHDSLLD